MIRRASSSKVTFFLPSQEVGAGVSVVGDFNQWDPIAHPLKKRSNGTHSAVVDLSRSDTDRYRFRYLAADGRFFDDTDADVIEPNGYGDTHSVLAL